MDVLHEPVVQLLQQLIAVDTGNPPGNEGAAAHLIAGWLRSAGLAPVVTDLGGGRANVLTKLRGKRSQPAQLWLGHLDTVPAGGGWTHPPFTPTIEDGRLVGRGASDMKGGVAAMTCAAMAIAQSGLELAQDLYFALTSDEEVGGTGVQQLMSEPFLSAVGSIVVGEPTSLQAGVCEKGALWLEIATQGKTAHGAAPELGINAILDMMRVMSALSSLSIGQIEHPLLGRSTCSIGTIRGGLQTNVVPDSCRITLDRRFLPGEDFEQFLQVIQTMLDKLDGVSAKTSVLSHHPSFETRKEAPIVQAVLASGEEAFGTAPKFMGINYFTDAAPLVAATGLPAVIIGPGDTAQMHAADESISLDQLRAAVPFYQLLARKKL